MSSPLPFSEEHRDCLQEVCNVAMGAAGESLAEFAHVFVNLSIPKIRYIQPQEIKEALASLDIGTRVSAVAQSFQMDRFENHGASAYALVVITEPSFNDLAQTSGRVLNTEAERIQLLSDLSQCINRTCLPRLAEMMESAIEFSDPEVLALHVPLDDLQVSKKTGWDYVVSVEINYHLEHHPFNCDLLLLLPNPMVKPLVNTLEALLAD